MREIRIKLQPKQLEAWRQICAGSSMYLFYGGAKGGGKSYLVRAKEFARRCRYPGTVGLIVRRTFPELLSNHIRKMFQEYPITRRWYKASEKAIVYPNGSITEFRHLDSTDDVYNFQGIEYDDITIDEATQHEEEVFKVIKTSLRQDPTVLERNPGYKPVFLLTGNPGGIGHQWVKRLFIDRDFAPNEKPNHHGFVQAKIWDNPKLIEANPEYLDNLRDLPEDLRKAYMDGDWNIFSGQYFTKLREHKHLIEPIRLDPNWLYFRSLDWGFAHPSVNLWWAVDYNGNAYIYRAFKTAEQVASSVARQIVDKTPTDERIVATVASPDLWARIKHDDFQTEATIADYMIREGLYIERAVNDRVIGWQALSELIEWDDDKKPEPRLKIFNTCKWVFDDLKKLIHDERNPEDAMKMDGDDTGDSARYGAMHIFKGAKPMREKTDIEHIIDRLPGGVDYEPALSAAQDLGRL